MGSLFLSARVGLLAALYFGSGRTPLAAAGGREEDRVAETMGRMLEEPNRRAHDSLLRGYFAELPAPDCGGAYAALCRLEKRQVSRWVTTLLSRWAECDPAGAWEVTRPWFNMVMAGEHLFDDWDERFIGPKDPHALESAPFWPQIGDESAFSKGLEKAAIPDAEKQIWRMEFAKHYLERFGKGPIAPGPEVLGPPPEEIGYTRVQEVLAIPLTDLPALLRETARRKNSGALLWGLRRWIAEDPAAPEQALTMAEEYEPEFVPEVVRAWARRDVRAADDWLKLHRPDELQDFLGETIAFLSPKERMKLLKATRAADRRYPDEGSFAHLICGWAKEDPKAALKAAAAMGNAPFYSLCADLCFSDAWPTPIRLRMVLDTIQSISTPVEDDHAYIVMEEWGEIDVGDAASFGVHWLLKNARSKRKHLIREWSGLENPADACMDDRTYGCLRKWAIGQPNRMAKWIKRQKEPEIRKALQWLLAHPNGNE
jgi:hypothetical protein